jgi:hypothetical protein
MLPFFILFWLLSFKTSFFMSFKISRLLLLSFFY